MLIFSKSLEHTLCLFKYVYAALINIVSQISKSWCQKTLHEIDRNSTKHRRYYDVIGVIHIQKMCQIMQMLFRPLVCKFVLP